MSSDIKVYPQDLCSQMDLSAVDPTPVTETAKGIIDLIFDPLCGDPDKQQAYAKAGYKQIQTELSVLEAIEIVNLDPDNPWDIFYRDDDPNIWQKNREANRLEFARNIQNISENILEPIRKRINYMYGDEVKIKVEYCFMSPSALIKYGLPEYHLFAYGKALLMRVEGERASAIYDEIKDWCKDVRYDDDETKNPEDDLKEEEEGGTPIEYGMMKLCNTEAEKQLIYITLPFTDDELKKDELLLVNKSNFYYTEANDFLTAPEPDTPTKLFPAYQEDNGVEELYNKIDDKEYEITKLEDQISDAIQNKRTDEANRLESKKKALQLEVDYYKNPTYEPENIRRRNLLEQLNETYATNESKRELNDLNKEIEKQPIITDSLTDYINKIEKLETSNVSSVNNVDISSDSLYFPGIAGVKCSKCKEKEANSENKIFSDYFMAFKLVALYIGIQCMEKERLDNPNDDNVSEEEVDEIYDYRMSILEAEKKKRKQNAYNNKIKELFPNGLDGVTEVPEIIVTEDDIDYSGLEEPNKEDIRKELAQEKIEELEIVKEAYATANLDKFYELNITTPMNLVEFSDTEIIDIKIQEYSKFDTQKYIVDLLKEYKNLISVEEDYNNIQSLSQFIKLNNLNPLLYYLCEDDSDYEDVKTFYFKMLEDKYKDDEKNKLKIKKSNLLEDILYSKGIDLTLMPQKGTREYADFSLDYIKCEIELYQELNDIEKLNQLTEIEIKLNSYYKNENWLMFDIDSFKTQIFTFTDIDYNVYRTKRIGMVMEDERESLENRHLASLMIYFKVKENEVFDNPYISLCSSYGNDSFFKQCLSNVCKQYINEDEEFINNSKIEINSFSNTLKDQLTILSNYLKNCVNSLNNFLDTNNNYIFNSLYVDSKLVELYNELNKNYICMQFRDYGIEYVELNEQIGDLLLNVDNTEENQYNIILKKSRLKIKRTLDYMIMPDIDKKIQNYEEEQDIALENGRINRANKIAEDILPEIKRLKKFREDYFETAEESDGYIPMREAQTRRYEFLSDLEPSNKYLFYKKVVNDITMDYEYSKGIFSDQLSDDEKLKLYLKETIKVVSNAIDNIPNGNMLVSEKERLEWELSYLENKNNEKENVKNDILEKMKLKKIDIDNEISKRENDLNYLHFVTWKNTYEENLKLKYKRYMRIESLPSTGIKYTFPFMLFDEFKKMYLEYTNKNISNYQLLDAYREYSEIDYNTYYIERKNYIKNHIDLWKNINYEPNISTMTKEVQTYLLLIDINGKSDVLQYINYTINCINGFIGIEPVVLSENESSFDVGLIIKIRRTNSFIEDIKYFLTNMFSSNLDEVNYELKHKDDIF